MDDRYEVVTIHKTQSLGPSDLLFMQFQEENLRKIAAAFGTPYEQYQRDVLIGLEDENVASVRLRGF